MSRLVLLFSAAALSLVVAPLSLADGDPASDILISSDVFLSFSAPATLSGGRELQSLTDAAKRKRFPIKVAVVTAKNELGLVTSLWRKPQSYAKFLGSEITFAFQGTLIVSMPNGFGVSGPGATPQARRALATVPAPGQGSPDAQARATVPALRAVAAANGHALPKPSTGSGTSTWKILLAIAFAIVLLGASAFAVLRRWLSRGLAA